MTADWVVEHRRAGAAELHAFTPPASAVPTMVVAEVTRAALVIGSTQPDDTVDHGAAAGLGLEVVRRRSGGAAVLVAPDAQAWVDVWIPRSDRRWDDDVVRAAIPVGRAWAAALAEVGAPGSPFVVHEGGVRERPWSHLVCFAGVGPGEVIGADGAKVVGISQRRTRDWTRLQTMVHRVWDVDRTLGALVLSEAELADARSALSAAVATIGTADPVPAFAAHL